MKITNAAVNNRTSIFVLIFIIIIQGVTAYNSLPREAAPDVQIPILLVSTFYPGVSPEDIETLITQPIEKELNTINEMKEISSSSFEGFSVIQAEFEAGYDLDDALQKVREKVDKAESDLPDDVEKPEIIEINVSEFPIYVFNISGPVGLVRLKELAEEMQDDLEKIEGVLEVKVNGGMEREVQVNVDMNELYHYKIRFNDIIIAIGNENRTIPGGSIDVNNSSFIVRVPGEFDDPYLIEDIIVKLIDGKPVYVKDVADVDYDFKDRENYARLNGTEAVSVSISKRVGENVIDIVEEAEKIIEKKQAELPDNIKFVVTTNYATNITDLLRQLENNIFSGLVLVVGVLFFFLGVRNSFFVAVAIPLSMLISFFIMQLMDIRLNFVVLFALILALGMLVDNAIVIIENIYRFLEEGYSKTDAAKKATAEVAWPVTTSTLTTLAAFLPLLFWPGMVGDFMSFIPLTLIITLASSLFVALIINPVLASVFMKVEKGHQKADSLTSKILKPFNKITDFFSDYLLPKTLDHYEKVLRFALDKRREKGQKISSRSWFGLLAVLGFFMVQGLVNRLPQEIGILVDLGLGIIVLLIFLNNRLRFLWGTFLMLFVITQVYFLFDHGVEFFPTTSPDQVNVNVEMPTGTNLEATNNLTRNVEKMILNSGIPDIDEIVTVVGSSTNPFDAGSTPNKATLTVKYIDYELRKQSSVITTKEIRNLVEKVPGAKITIKMQQMGPPTGLPVNIEIAGDDYHRLGSISQQIKEEIKDVPGLVDLSDNYDAGKPEIRIDVDREKAALYSLNTTEIANFVRTAINGAEASKYRVGEDEYDITVRLKKEQRKDIQSVRNMKLIYNNNRGRTLNVPLMTVADVYRATGPGAIRRIDLERVIIVSGDAAEGYNANNVLDAVKKELEDFQLPPGYSVSYTGQSEFQEEASDFLGRAFFIALFSIFLILVIQFNSISQPFIIMSAVIISLIGVFIGLIFFALPFGIIMTGIGVISLAGVVVNNNIVLIDYMNQLRKKGLTRREAVVQAGLRRFRPVTLTAITTILGLIPLSFGLGFDVRTFSFSTGGESAEFWRSMGIAVIFGLAFATFLTLVIVPVMYSTLEDIPDVAKQGANKLKNGIKRLFGKKSK